MNRFRQMSYTVRHKKAFLQIERKLCGNNSLSGYLHDLDKLFLYPILGVKRAARLHRKFSRHHKRASKFAHYIQMAIDWECARLTKPDKPLNAYETLMQIHPELKHEMIPVLDYLGINKGGDFYE